MCLSIYFVCTGKVTKGSFYLKFQVEYISTSDMSQRVSHFWFIFLPQGWDAVFHHLIIYRYLVYHQLHLVIPQSLLFQCPHANPARVYHMVPKWTKT